jgi:RNA polymerase sigma-70 factor (ECF subfamily)
VRGKTIEIPSPEADALVARAIEGDPSAFADLFELTLPSVYRFLYGRCGDASLAEDLAQDAYLRAMKAVRSSFVGGSTEFIAWMIRIARNRFLDHVKSGRMRWEIVVDELPLTFAKSDTEHEAIEKVAGADLRDALKKLTDDQQEIVFLRFFQGLQIAEVAGITGRTEGAVKALQFRALRALERVLVADPLVDLGADAEDDAR